MTKKIEYFQGNEWMCTASGKHVYPLGLRETDIDIRDIAHHLSMQCRYNGAVSKFYSVAEHCIAISHALGRDGYSPMIQLQGLVHDAAETYTGDMIRPVKNSLRAIWDKWKHIEDGNERTIAVALGVAYPFDPVVKLYDRRIIADEKETFGMNTWHWDQEPLGVELDGLMPQAAQSLYMITYNQLKNELVKKAA